MYSSQVRALWALALISLFPALLFANSLSKIEKLELWQCKEWKRLLHVQPSIFLFERSEADSESFFLAKNGKFDFKAELFALAKHVLGPSALKNINDNHAICRFPARTIWLYKKLDTNFNENVLLDCTEYQKYLKLVTAESVSLVFSSYYLESPASAFGHTLLRLGRPKNKNYQNTDLLDMGINSAAQITTDNALVYSIMGIFGGFVGNYSAIPYFYKVREYNDFESRDLWSYDLNLNSKQLARMINHIWEVGNTTFDYYYFTENCSYNLLTLLEVADFNLDLISRLPFLYTIPSHTVQVANDIPGFIKKISVTPSLRKTFDYYFNKLDSKQANLLLDAYYKRDQQIILGSQYDNKIKTEMLDALIYFVDFKHPSEILLDKGKIAEWKRQILVERSKMNEKGWIIPAQVSDKEAPHLGHRPRKIMAKISHYDDEVQYHLGYRLSHHSIMDPHIGQPALASLEFGDMEIFYRDKKIKIEKFDFFEIMTLNPWTRYAKPFSFRAKVGFRNEQVMCNNCTLFSIDVGGGATFFHNGPSTFYAFLNPEVVVDKHFKNKINLQISPEVGFKQIWDDSLVSYAIVRYNYSLETSNSYWSGSLKNSYFHNNFFGIFLNILYVENHDFSFKSGINYYF